LIEWFTTHLNKAMNWKEWDGNTRYIIWKPDHKEFEKDVLTQITTKSKWNKVLSQAQKENV
jgi:hypothetical protein